MTLKTKNTPFVIGYVVLLYVGFAIINGLDWSFAKNIQMTKNGIIVATPILTLVFHFVALVFSYLLSSLAKSQIIFFRIHHPLPGSRVFTDLIQKDPRITRSELENKYGQLPTIPDQQNALWYRIYKEKERDQVVIQSQGKWLLFRDIFSITLLLFIPTTILLC